MNGKRPTIMGVVETILPEWQNSTGSFHKQDLVVDAGFRYPNPIKITFKNDNMALLNELNVGDKVIVEYAVDGRKWEGPNGTQYFVDIAGLGLTRVGIENAPTAAPTTAAPTTAAATPTATASAATADAAYKVWTEKHGKTPQDFATFCKTERPDIQSAAAAINKRFTDYCANRPDVWADVINRINGVDTADDEFEELPF